MTDDNDNKNRASAGLPQGWTRYTIIVKEEHLEKLRAFSFWNRIPIKGILDRILEKFFHSKQIKPIPPVEEDALDKLWEEILSEDK